MASPQIPVIQCYQCGAALSKVPFTVPDPRILEPSSAILAQIRSKYIPAETEMGNIAIRIEEARRAIHEREKEIRWLRPTLEKLESERDDLQRYLESYSTLSSPIRKLPAEILTEILSYSSTLIIGDGVQCRTLDYSQVCSYWRQLVSSCSQLWSTLQIDLYDVDAETLLLMKHYIAKSNASPLTLHISNLGGDAASEPDEESWLSDSEYQAQERVTVNALRAFTVLLHQSHRWRHLSLDVRASFFETFAADPEFSCCDVPFPILEAFNLINGPVASLGTDCELVSALQRAPRLQSLHFPEVYLKMSSLNSYAPPFSQITILHICCNEDLDIYTLLPRCPRLRTLEIDHGKRLVLPSVPVVHESLRDLTLYFPNYSHLSLVFEEITLPKLVSLTLSSSTVPHTQAGALYAPSLQQWLPDDFLVFLSRSACSLRSLSLGTFEILGIQLHRILRVTPDLTHLSVKEYHVSFDPSLLLALTLSTSPDSTPPALLPKLTDLEVEWHEYKHQPEDVLKLVSMVESRSLGRSSISNLSADTVVCMNKFSFRYSPVHSPQRGYQVHPEFLSRMKALATSASMNVSMRHMDGKRIRLLK
ncbi:hypothetical protein D9758_002448 [Tetrapyrgos nigripes]|uniref:F-box domain-containing protein n=1 Tax=Tetrapyrgos nigripes TaxID=182062 RepID=A0A8H5GP07_9AGAR|nr:hypothetical protein D9758_002448 [Tetrapyrgos nigripes]